LFNCINVFLAKFLMWPVRRICPGGYRLNVFKDSDSDCCHHDQNCAASVVVVHTLQLQHNSILY